MKPRAAAWRAAAAPMPEDAPVTTAHDARSLAAGEPSAAESSTTGQSIANIANTTLSVEKRINHTAGCSYLIRADGERIILFTLPWYGRTSTLRFRSTRRPCRRKLFSRRPCENLSLHMGCGVSKDDPAATQPSSTSALAAPLANPPAPTSAVSPEADKPAAAASATDEPEPSSSVAVATAF